MKELFLKGLFIKCFILFLSLSSLLLICPCKSVSDASKHSGNDTVTNAKFLSLSKTYSDSIPANESHYYCVSYKKKLTFQLQSTKMSGAVWKYFTDTGRRISPVSSMKQPNKQTDTLLVPKRGKYIFLKITNISHSSLAIRLSAEKINSSLRKSKKVSKKAVTSPSEKKQSVTPDAISVVCPHFLYMKQNGSHMVTLTNTKKSSVSKYFKIISTNTDVVTIKKNKITAVSPGTAILYFKSKSSSFCNRSCLIRVM